MCIGIGKGKGRRLFHTENIMKKETQIWKVCIMVNCENLLGKINFRASRLKLKHIAGHFKTRN